MRDPVVFYKGSQNKFKRLDIDTIFYFNIVRTIKKCIVKTIKVTYYVLLGQTWNNGLRFFEDDNDTRDVKQPLREHGLVELYVQHEFEVTKEKADQIMEQIDQC